jgi:muramoyltetrapeptide carboxypeptidase
MNRARRTITSIPLAALIGGLPQLTLGKTAKPVSQSTTHAVSESDNRRPTRPPRLRRGDGVALINPGGVVSEANVERAVANAESLGLVPQLGRNLRLKYGGYAGSARERVDDLHAAWRDPDVKAIWSVRGGSGTAQILPLVDFALLRATTKVLMGFSDMTALLNAVTTHAGLITFHTPSGISTLSPYSRRNIEQILFDAPQNYAMLPALENEARSGAEPEYAVRTQRGGRVEGELVGGNLAVFASLVGTAYMPSLANKILFLEDINEAPYRIDRMLTQLVQAMTHTKQFPVATVFGVCRRCEATDGEASLTLQEVIRDYAASQPGPVASGYSFGHIAAQMSLPIGARAALDTYERSLTLIEAAVV